MKETKRIPFDLERAKNGARVITREGFDVEIISYNSGDSKYPIVGKIDEGRKDEVHHLWQKDGTSAPFEYNNEDREDYDLLLVVEVEEALQKFNDAYAYVSNMIISLLQEDGKRITSDIRNLGRSVERAAMLMHMLKQSIRAYSEVGDTEELIQLKETILDNENKRKKNLI